MLLYRVVQETDSVLQDVKGLAPRYRNSICKSTAGQFTELIVSPNRFSLLSSSSSLRPMLSQRYLLRQWCVGLALVGHCLR